TDSQALRAGQEDAQAVLFVPHTETTEGIDADHVRSLDPDEELRRVYVPDQLIVLVVHGDRASLAILHNPLPVLGAERQHREVRDRGLDRRSTSPSVELHPHRLTDVRLPQTGGSDDTRVLVVVGRPEIRLRGLAVHADEHDVQVLVHRLDGSGQDGRLTLLRQRLGDALLRDGTRQLDEALVQVAISHMPYASTRASSSGPIEAPSIMTFPATSSPAPRPHRRSRDADQECSRTTATLTRGPPCAPTQRPPCWRPPGSPGPACSR